ncbi:DUF5665 domain-containing protein [Microaerobacter geothermalis]|uniref:DUF5665 domain-containing protein n=1 Tax=Microaerobacter geothermalis TaxID=674972 RepID=UPI001F22441A|nr:DUF5665 domain-containing protein [Microaerobacter geothermalis]MCF6093553.1 DUF5665 domain-containing protein [Microaerobacter geothermalis]
MDENRNHIKKVIGEMDKITEKLNEVNTLNRKLESIAMHLERARIHDVLQNFNHPLRVIGINFLVGLSRGLGLTVGTAIILGFLAIFLKQFISLPIVGEYISDLLDYVQYYQDFKGR